MAEPRRVSDVDRDAAISRLNAAVDDGALTLDEFSERSLAVYAARSSAELADTLADLPTTDSAPRGATVHRSLIGTFKHGGRWRLPARTAVETLLGTVKLDLRQAEIDGLAADVVASATIGTIKVWVPAGWRVEVWGNSTIGGRYVDENHLPPGADAPTLRLRLDTFLGTVKVYRV